MIEHKWLNEDSRTFLSRGYLKPGVTPEERIRKIAETAEKYLKIDGFADKFETYLSYGWYSLASPVWSNFGEEKALPISCNGGFIHDSVADILTSTAEVGMMSKYGAGTSGYFGELRPRGSDISAGGKTFGAVHFMQLFDMTTNIISQSNVRRGSFAAYYPVEGGDIDEFLEIRSEGNAIQNMSIGVTITDKWMQEMEGGDKQKRATWAKILKKRFESGYPYIFWTDTVNNNSPKVYKDKGMKIHASNLCVAPDTLLLTDKGNIAIQILENQEVNAWNGFEWSKVTVKKTGESKTLTKVTLSDGSFIECTPQHKWWIRDEDNYKESYIEVTASDLEDYVGVIVMPYSSHINGKKTEDRYIVSVEKDIRIADTFCANEPKRHKLIFNGILTGNCSEIALSSSEKDSFVCDLSSMNLLHFDDWKHTDAVEILTYFLDAVMEEYIMKTKEIPYMEKAHHFALTQRALGVGGLGWHSYLQSKMIPFESMEAKLLNNQIWKFIQEKTIKASKEMAELYGEPELLKGYGMRNVCLQAIAPTTSSSFILGQISPSIEPLSDNYFVKDLAKGRFTFKNPQLIEVLKKYKKNDKATWKSVLDHGGSVQHLDFLSDLEKSVFKTFGEISQREIVIQAAARQKYIDQSQSLNLKIHPLTPLKEVNELMLFAWKSGVKTLYYQRGTNPSQELTRNLNECVNCEA